VQGARNGNATACADCGQPIAPKRGSRRQQFCSERCQKRAARSRNWQKIYGTPGPSGSVQNTQDNSSGCKPGFASRASGIVGPDDVILAEVVDAHQWQVMTAKDGECAGWLTYLQPRALREPRP
jgi:hypothetical protein